MIRLALALLLVLPWTRGWSQTFDSKETDITQSSESKTGYRSELPDAPGAPSVPFLQSVHINTSFTTRNFDLKSPTVHQTPDTAEHYHWKGLLVQSFYFDMLSNATRVITSDQDDRHILLNKPYWSDYWASLQQFNMRRWNDGDSIKVNYIGHPMEGAIAGYIEVQNDPRGRDLQISRGRPYWNSRFRAFLWETVYSTQWEIGPIGETAIFNQGGFTYPIGCPKNDVACEATAKYTNNTGWVDFIITPIAGTLWMIGEDAIDRFISDPLVRRHPNSFGIKMVRASLNPPASLANMLRGHYPWWRDYEKPGDPDSPLMEEFQEIVNAEPQEHGDIYLHYSALGLGTNTATCIDCRNTIGGAGVGFGVAIRRYFDITADFGLHPNASPGSSLNVGGSLTTANFGIRSGYSGEKFAVKVSVAPGFASYSQSQPAPTEADPNPQPRRNFNFSTAANLSGDVRLTPHFAIRTSLEQMLIRYKSTMRDPPGIGTPPRLSFLSHDNYINSTNWGVTVGPVLRF